jgi:hypothetical protein
MFQMLVRDGFDIRRHALSLLTNGDLGWIQILNFVLTGLLVIAGGGSPVDGNFNHVPGGDGEARRTPTKCLWSAWRTGWPNRPVTKSCRFALHPIGPPLLIHGGWV